MVTLELAQPCTPAARRPKDDVFYLAVKRFLVKVGKRCVRHDEPLAKFFRHGIEIGDDRYYEEIERPRFRLLVEIAMSTSNDEFLTWVRTGKLSLPGSALSPEQELLLQSSDEEECNKDSLWCLVPFFGWLYSMDEAVSPECN